DVLGGSDPSSASAHEPQDEAHDEDDDAEPDEELRCLHGDAEDEEHNPDDEDEQPHGHVCVSELSAPANGGSWAPLLRATCASSLAAPPPPRLSRSTRTCVRRRAGTALVAPP